MPSLKRHKRFCRYKKCICTECGSNRKCPLWKDTKGFVDSRNAHIYIYLYSLRYDTLHVDLCTIYLYIGKPITGDITIYLYIGKPI